MSPLMDKKTRMQMYREAHVSKVVDNETLLGLYDATQEKFIFFPISKVMHFRAINQELSDIEADKNFVELFRGYAR